MTPFTHRRRTIHWLRWFESFAFCAAMIGTGVIVCCLGLVVAL